MDYFDDLHHRNSACGRSNKVSNLLHRRLLPGLPLPPHPHRDLLPLAAGLVQFAPAASAETAMWMLNVAVR